MARRHSGSLDARGAEDRQVLVADAPVAHERAWLAGLILVGVILRLLAVTVFSVEPSQDAAALEQVGHALAAGQGYIGPDGAPDTVLPPGVPALIATTSYVFGPSRLAVTTSQALLDLVACVVLWAWMRKRVSPRIALLTLAFAVVSLSAIGSARIPRGECLGTAFLVVALALFDLSGAARRPWLWLLAAGVACGILTFFRWNFSLLPLFLLPFIMLRPERAPVRVRGIAAFLSAYALVLTPWIVRNYHILGEPVLSTQTGITLYSSHFRVPGQPYGNNTRDETTERAERMKPLEGSHYLVAETSRRLRDDPKRLFTQYPIKLFWLAQPFDWETLSWPVLGTRSFNITYFLTALLATIGLWTAWRRDRLLTALLLLPMAYLAVLSFPFYGSPRFRVPAEPFLMPLAAFGVLGLIHRLKARQVSLPVATSPASIVPASERDPIGLNAGEASLSDAVDRTASLHHTSNMADDSS